MDLEGGELLSKRKRRKSCLKQNFVGVGVADAAEKTWVGEGALQGVICGQQNGGELHRVGLENLNATGIQLAKSGLARNHMEKARFWEPASVQRSDPTGKSNAARPRGGEIFTPRARQWSLPAIIKCKTSQRSPSRPIQIRFPTRRKRRGFLPVAVPSGGVAVRSRNGLTTRTCSSVCPRMRLSSASM